MSAGESIEGWARVELPDGELGVEVRLVAEIGALGGGETIAAATERSVVLRSRELPIDARRVRTGELLSLDVAARRTGGGR